MLNDSQAAAMGEYTCGEGRKAESNLVVINVRHGIGAGLVINNQLSQGDGGGAGEIGGVVVVPESGLPCRCGNRCCLVTVASAQAIVRRAKEFARQSGLVENPEAITFTSPEQAFSAGEPVSRQVVMEAGYYMGMAISSLIGTLNIRKILLSDELTRFSKLWPNVIRFHFRELVERFSMALAHVAHARPHDAAGRLDRSA